MRLILAAVLLAGLLALPAAPAHADRLEPPFDVYEAGPLPAASFARAGGPGDPWLVLHQERQGGTVWVLLALPDGNSAADLWGTGRPRYLGRVREGERIVFVAPEISARERLSAGRPLTIAPSNGTVIVTRETADRFAARAHQAFRMLEYTVPAPEPDRAGPAPAMARALERARAGLRTPDDVDAVINAVQPESLETYVRTLSQGASWPTGPLPQFRYYAHPNTETIHKAYIEEKFAEALGDANVRNHSFQYPDPDGAVRTFHNVVGVLPSAVPSAGAFLLTAHYDAIGTRSVPATLCQGGRDPAVGCDCTQSASAINGDPACAWDWLYDPSPGADDNATGVAVLIEAARLLAPLSFDFDVYFVAFQTEELGLIGSAAFADSLAGAGREVYGVLNMDMLGYNALRNEADIVTDEGSEWLADFLLETGETFVPDLAVEKHVVFFGRSDHASFWSAGYDAILLFEDINLPYPGYHTSRDLWGTIFPSSGRPNSELQFQLAAQLGIGAVARFAVHYSAPDLAVPAGELLVRPQFGVFLEEDRPLLLTARVHNYGASQLVVQGVTTDSLTARVTFYDGDPAQGAPVIASVDRKDFFPAGGVVEMAAAWTPGAGQAGFHDVHAEVTGLDAGYAQFEPSAANNVGVQRIFVRSPGSLGPSVLSHYVYPNPVVGSRSDLGLYIELSRQVRRLSVEIFDLSGQRVGSFLATEQFVDDGNLAGENRLTGSQDFAWDGPDLQPGVYVYSIRCFDDDGSVSDVQEGKFALVR
jgi:hypothetical protein